MAAFKAPVFTFGGLNTRANATGLPLMEMTVLQDMRVVGKDLFQRKGMVGVGQVAGDMSAMDFVAASSQFCSNEIDTRVWALGLYWTVELAIEPDLTSGTPGVFVAGSTTPSQEVYITGGDLTWKGWDSGGTPTTITIGAAAASVQTVQITRSAATISTKLNNGTAVTGSMSATLDMRTPVGDLRVARDDSTNYYDGTVDYLRVLSRVKADHADRLVRLPNPRARSVLADYDFNESADGLVYDRSRYENHLITSASPTEVTTLCHNPAPVRALGMNVDKDGRKQLLVAAGGKYYLAGAD